MVTINDPRNIANAVFRIFAALHIKFIHNPIYTTKTMRNDANITHQRRAVGPIDRFQCADTRGAFTRACDQKVLSSCIRVSVGVSERHDKDIWTAPRMDRDKRMA